MPMSTKTELLEENARLKKSYENLERRIATISKWIILNFDPVPAEIKIVLQYKDYDMLLSRIKDFKSFADREGKCLPTPSRELRSCRKKDYIGNVDPLDEDSMENDSDDNESEESEFDPGIYGQDDSDFLPGFGSDSENGTKPDVGDICGKSRDQANIDSKSEIKNEGNDLKTGKSTKKRSHKKKEKTGERPKKDKVRNTKCHICDKILATNKSLKHHLKTHSAEKPFLCNECGQSFIAQYYLTCHLRQHVPIAERKKYECEVCGSVQTNKAGFNRHVRRHAGLEQHQCSICGIMFTGRSALRRHIVGVHEKRRPHACDQCDKQFKTRAHLKTHMKVHEGDKSHRGRSLNRDSEHHKPRRRGLPNTQSQLSQANDEEVINIIEAGECKVFTPQISYPFNTFNTHSFNCNL